ncbi:MAG: TVP38/TMEM64 family protein [Treponema sp.]|nr:TVP38/TMEM64 family protein [Treponema sp.]
MPQSRKAILSVVAALGSVDSEPVKAFILSFGPFAVIVSFLLMIAQAIAAPFPAFVITFANAALFGWLRGAALSWASAMAGAAICFGVARLFGRVIVEKLAGKYALDSIDDFFLKHGALSITAARLLPFVPFDPVSYAAGFTKMNFFTFLLATGIGQLPATIVYSYFGSTLGGGGRIFFQGLCALFALVCVSAITKSIYANRKAKKHEVTQNERRQ